MNMIMQQQQQQNLDQSMVENSADAQPESGSNKKSTTKLQTSLVLNTKSVIRNRVYILGLEDSKRISIKEVTYMIVDPSMTSARGGRTSLAVRPVWVPNSVLPGSWSVDPPCYWTTSIIAMQDLETVGDSKLDYSPMTDYSLEIIRWYRPDIFDGIYHLFRVWNKALYNERQLAQLKELIRPESVMVDDLDDNFGAGSPLAAMLKDASIGADFLPEIEHYLTLLNIRAFKLRDAIIHTR